MQKDLSKAMKPIKLLIAIAPRGRGTVISKIAHDLGAHGGIVSLGRGTATSEILDILGIGGTDKDIFVCAVFADESHDILMKLSEKMGFEKPGGGIAFTVPIQSIGGLDMFFMLTGQNLLGKE